MLSKYMKGVKVLMMREGEKRKLSVGLRRKKKGKKDKRPENIE